MLMVIAYLLHNKKLTYAEELIRRAINIDPGNAAILDSLAWALYLDGSYKDAYEYASLAYTKIKILKLLLIIIKF